MSSILDKIFTRSVTIDDDRPRNGHYFVILLEAYSFHLDEGRMGLILDDSGGTPTNQIGISICFTHSHTHTNTHSYETYGSKGDKVLKRLIVSSTQFANRIGCEDTLNHFGRLYRCEVACLPISEGQPEDLCDYHTLGIWTTSAIKKRTTTQTSAKWPSLHTNSLKSTRFVVG